MPDELPCREVEFCTIFEFIHDQLCSGLGGCLFVSGVPGTGKTATIRSVARSLKDEREAGNLYVTFRLDFHHFDHFELDLRGHIHVRGAAFFWLRLELADIVLI